MTEIIKNNFEVIWDRIKRETPLKNLSELAEIAGITQSGLSKAKGKNHFSASWAYSVAKKYGLLTEWIMTGEGPKRLDERPVKNDFFLDLQEWGKEMSGSEHIEWMKRQIESLFPAFKKWREGKEESDKDETNFPASKIA